MRRTELIDGIHQLLHALESSNLETVLLDVLKGGEDREGLNARLLGALMTYSFMARSANQAAKHVADLFDLAQLEDPPTWSKLVSEQNKGLVSELAERIDFVRHYLPRITQLVNPSAQGLPADEQREDTQVLTVIVLEAEEQMSSPERLEKVLQSVNRLYSVCAAVAGVPDTRLSVVGCDSGGDKSFEFLGAKPAVERLRRLILSLWDRVVFFRGHRLTTRINLVAETLPIIDQISELERDQEIGPEQAEILRRHIVEGVTRFLEAGAIIPEIQEQVQHNPRSLMTPAPKLLVHADATSPGASTTTEAASPPLDALSAEDTAEEETTPLDLQRTEPYVNTEE